MENMNAEPSPLGRAGFLVLPLGIALAVMFKTFLTPVLIGAATGWLIANVRAVLFVGEMRKTMQRNPLVGLQAKVQGVDSSMQIRYIFIQSLVGSLVVAAWTVLACGIAQLIR